MKKWVVKLIVNKTYAAVVEAETREEAIVAAMDGGPSQGWTRWTEDPLSIKTEVLS